MFQPEHESWKRFKYSFVPSTPALLIGAVSQHPLLDHCNCHVLQEQALQCFPQPLGTQASGKRKEKNYWHCSSTHPAMASRKIVQIESANAFQGTPACREAKQSTFQHWQWVLYMYIYSIYGTGKPLKLFGKKGELAFQKCKWCFGLKCFEKRDRVSSSATDQLWMWTGSLLPEQHVTNLPCSEAKRLKTTCESPR